MKIPLTITQEGLTALLDAEAGETTTVRVAELGLSSSPFVMAPTLTALPSEFIRIPVTSGEAAAENIIHFVAQDDSDETYEATGLGIYLDNGVLFAVFSHTLEDGVLFGKSSSSTFLFAADLTFEAGVAQLIDFGDSNFTYPPATEGRKGVAYLATADDVAAGLDGEKIVTPAQLAGHYIPLSQRGVANGVATLGANGKVPPSQLGAVDSIDTFTVASEAEMLALAAAGPGDFARRTDESLTYVLTQTPASVLDNWQEFLSPGAPVRSVNGEIGDVVLDAADVGAAPAGRAVNGGGLVKGGGSLVADRTLTVDIATALETIAGEINDKAVTPASLASLIALAAGAVPSARKILTSGLATGGGPLTADRTIDVPKATAADVEALTDNSKAVTVAALAGTLRSLVGPGGYLRIPGTPVILQWGYNNVPTSGVRSVSFPVAFPTECFQTMMTPYSDPDDGDESDEIPFVTNQSRTGFNCRISGDNKLFYFGFLAIGM